eukprot:jgi/Picsp_1/5825/NSC_03184-R1_---NA---
MQGMMLRIGASCGSDGCARTKRTCRAVGRTSGYLSQPRRIIHTRLHGSANDGDKEVTKKEEAASSSSSSTPPPLTGGQGERQQPGLAKGQSTAIITGAISIIFGIAYLALVQFMDLRGGELQPPPPEAYMDDPKTDRNGLFLGHQERTLPVDRSYTVPSSFTSTAGPVFVSIIAESVRGYLKAVLLASVQYIVSLTLNKQIAFPLARITALIGFDKKLSFTSTSGMQSQSSDGPELADVSASGTSFSKYRAILGAFLDV